jgi:hypothetical protein
MSPRRLIKRNWTQYNKETLIILLREIEWELASDTVQGCWDEFENKLVKIVDEVVPMEVF